MTAAEEHEHLHDIVDRLPLAEARRLLVLVESDPALSRFTEDEESLPPAIERPGFAAFVGMGRSGHHDTARRHRELIADWSDDER
ncbi:hypothetical protein [Streptomyces huasconensis]|uniref:hypothetical protein n=1 Tax=Streptomyces huasconensis TaxID=1854574 RepID=UPI0033DD6D31